MNGTGCHRSRHPLQRPDLHASRHQLPQRALDHRL